MLEFDDVDFARLRFVHLKKCPHVSDGVDIATQVHLPRMHSNLGNVVFDVLEVEAVRWRQLVELFVQPNIEDVFVSVVKLSTQAIEDLVNVCGS